MSPVVFIPGKEMNNLLIQPRVKTVTKIFLPKNNHRAALYNIKTIIFCVSMKNIEVSFSVPIVLLHILNRKICFLPSKL